MMGSASNRNEPATRIVFAETSRYRSVSSLAGWVFVTSMVILAALLLGPRSASAAIPSAEFPITTDARDEYSPAISGGTVVWTDTRDGNPEIYARRVPGEALASRVTSDPAEQRKPAISGDMVVWEDNQNGDWDIYGYDLSTLPAGQAVPIAVGAGDQRNPDISGSTVVWEDNASGDWNIYRKDLPDGQKQAVVEGTEDQRRPAIDGRKVVWQQQNGIGNSDIYAKDLVSGEQRQLTTDPDWQEDPDVSGDTVVWTDDRNPGNLDVYGYDLRENSEFRVTTNLADQHSSAVSGRIVAWIDGRGADGYDVYGKDLSTGREFVIKEGSGAQDTPALDGETVAWESQRVGLNMGWDIYGANLDIAPAAPSGLKAAGLPGGVKLDWSRNLEGDLAGYNVYRSDSPDGEYAKLNADLLVTPSYLDAGAPKGVRFYYRVTAADRPAGQESAAARANAVAPKPTEIALSAGPAELPYSGGITTLSGRLASGADGLANRSVILEQKPEGASAWSAVAGGQQTTADDGSFSMAGVRVAKSTQYRARFAGTEDLQSSISPTAMVNVKLLLSVGTSLKTLKAGQPLTIYGMVLPAYTGRVQLTIERNGATVSRQFTLLNNSRYSLRYRPLSPGVYYVSATFNSSLGQGVTNTARFVVKR